MPYGCGVVRHGPQRPLPEQSIVCITCHTTVPGAQFHPYCIAGRNHTVVREGKAFEYITWHQLTERINLFEAPVLLKMDSEGADTDPDTETLWRARAIGRCWVGRLAPRAPLPPSRLCTLLPTRICFPKVGRSALRRI